MEKQLEEQVATLKQLQEELAEVKEQHANKNSGGDPSALTNEKKMSPDNPCMYERDVAAVASRVPLIRQVQVGGQRESGG